MLERGERNYRIHVAVGMIRESKNIKEGNFIETVKLLTVAPREALCALLQRQMGRGYPGRRTCGIRGRFRGIFVRVRPFENGTMIKEGTPKGAPPTHKAPQRGSFSAFGQGTHFQETQKFR